MNLLDMTGPDPAEAICSRKGCRNTATTRLLWNNPKIHAPERRKAWLACDEHATWLQDYLQERSLWKETLPMTSEGPA
ncbi:acetone carboxylase [Bacillus sp. SRB_336]|nr:acetone carboxylase [Bacillus sp. SRB_336]